MKTTGFHRYSWVDPDGRKHPLRSKKSYITHVLCAIDDRGRYFSYKHCTRQTNVHTGQVYHSLRGVRVVVLPVEKITEHP